MSTSARTGGSTEPKIESLERFHEYARHNGHADFLPEGIDGTVGV
jgi:Protein of unknown function (DUF664)